MRTILLVALAVLGAAFAFRRFSTTPDQGPSVETGSRPGSNAPHGVDPPPLGADDAYARALDVKLKETEAEESPGLHNVYRLSDRIVSGSEPHGEAAFRRLKAMGVKTVLSVDGKVPEVDLAGRFGLRYVHVPIQYCGVPDEEFVRITKTFRQLEPPFYVHCFHGKHRGPTAAAIGRLVLDGVSRETALAEMRQWCGTSRKYAGLYRDIANKPIPTEEQSRVDPWNFASRQPLEGFRHAMIEVTRADDHLRNLSDRNWKPDPSHPDLDALNEAGRLADLFERSARLPDVMDRPEDFRRWAAEAADWSRKLQAQLRAMNDGDSAAAARARTAYTEIRNRCTDCHRRYRNG